MQQIFWYSFPSHTFIQFRSLGSIQQNWPWQEMGKRPIKKLQKTQFHKYYMGLNRRAPNVISTNDVGRLSPKLNIYTRILKFWIHLENFPENSVAKQCLQISIQLAEKRNPTLCPLWKNSFYSKSNLRKGCKYSRIHAHDTKTV